MKDPQTPMVRSEAPAPYYAAPPDCPMCRKWQDDSDLRIAELDTCYVVLNRDQFFAGYCFVFAKAHVTELFHLDAVTRHAVIDEVSRVAAALAQVYRPTKVNYELLGNMVPHMHWHVVPRFTDGPLWPKPIWSEPHTEVILAADEYAAAIARIRAALVLRPASLTAHL